MIKYVIHIRKQFKNKLKYKITASMNQQLYNPNQTISNMSTEKSTEKQTDFNIAEEQYIETPWSIIDSYFKDKHLERLVRHQLESYNNFVGFQIIKTIEMFNPVHIKSENDFDKELFETVLKSNQIALVVPGSGVDIDYYFPREDQKSEINFLFIGRLVREKGILEYLEAAKRLKVQYPDLKFGLLGPIYTNSIAGSAIDADLINIYVNEYGLKYYGESKEVDKFISKTECLVLPSYGEGISNVLLEAGAMAKPLITTNVPGCREIVENGRNGLLCEPKNVDSLKNAMESFINLSNLEKANMGAQSRKKIVSEFSKSSVIEKYLKLLIKL